MRHDPTDAADTPSPSKSAEPSPSGLAYLRWSGRPDGPCLYSAAAARLLALDPMRRASIDDYVRRVHRDDRRRVRRILDRAARAQARAVFEHRWLLPDGAPDRTTVLWCGPAEDRHGAPGAAAGPRHEGRAANVARRDVLAVLLDVDGAHRYHHGVDGHSMPALLSELAQLSSAVASRDIIGQAKGFLMARHGCDADEAFTLLSAMSNETNVPVNALAERLVNHKRPL